jgi:hypothetical protein
MNRINYNVSDVLFFCSVFSISAITILSILRQEVNFSLMLMYSVSMLLLLFWSFGINHIILKHNLLVIDFKYYMKRKEKKHV